MPVCKYETIAATCSRVSLWSNEGIVFLPLEITMRTSSSVAGLPLGSRSCAKTRWRLGGTFLRANWFSSWQAAQFALYRLRPYSCSLVSRVGGRRSPKLKTTSAMIAAAITLPIKTTLSIRRDPPIFGLRPSWLRIRLPISSRFLSTHRQHARPLQSGRYSSSD